jgi:hypothetical protein
MSSGVTMLIRPDSEEMSRFNRENSWLILYLLVAFCVSFGLPLIFYILSGY